MSIEMQHPKDLLPEPEFSPIDQSDSQFGVNQPQASDQEGFNEVDNVQTESVKFGHKLWQGLDFSVSRALLLLSIPALSVVIFFASKVFTDPINFYWLISAEPPSIPTYGLEPPLSLAEINAQLKDSDRILGKKLEFAKDDKRQRSPDPVSIYPVLDTANQEIREVRVYQTLPNSGKLQLLSRAEINGLEDWFVLTPKNKIGNPEKVKLRGDRLGLRQLQQIKGKAPSYGAWFLATGSTARLDYGVVLAYSSQPRPSLIVLSEWTSMAGKPPQWQDLLQTASNWAVDRKQSDSTQPSEQKLINKGEPQLVIEQHQDFEPDFQIYQPELVSNPLQPLDLRQITLNEGLGLPVAYGQSLILASAGAWSTALEKLEMAKAELQTQQKPISTYFLEQYALIASHAQVTANQADSSAVNPGRQALLYMIDGRWQEAIAITETSENNTKSVLQVLKPFSQNILVRVEALRKLKYENLKLAQTAGAIAVMADQGLQAAKKWILGQLKSEDSNSSEIVALLDRLDVLPFKIKPQQVLGIVTPITNRDPGKGWLVATESLPETESWYVVDVSLVLNQDNWQTAIFNELIGRSPTAVWKLLGLNRSDTLTLSILDDLGLSANSFLRAHSYAVSSEGKLRLLVAGSPDLAESLKKSEIPAIATTNGTLPATTGVDTTPSNLPTPILEMITTNLYQELQSLGEVSLRSEEFRRQLSGWTLKSIDLNGDGKVDYVLEIDRLKVDMGDRRYPIIVAFDNGGNILYSEVLGESSRRWVTILPGRNGGQILTEVEGNYQIWSLP